MVKQRIGNINNGTSCNGNAACTKYQNLRSLGVYIVQHQAKPHVGYNLMKAIKDGASSTLYYMCEPGNNGILSLCIEEIHEVGIG